MEKRDCEKRRSREASRLSSRVVMTLCTQPAIMALLCAAQRNREVETIEVVAKTREGIYIKTGHQVFCFGVPPFSTLTEKEREQ